MSLRGGAYRMNSERMIPPMLYLPTRARADGEQFPEIRELPDGRRALVAFTALDRLAESCGPNQPWIVIPTESLGQVKDVQPFDLVTFDPAFAPHLLGGGRLM